MPIEKAIEITDAKISFVSLVDKAANKAQLLIAKADDGKANITGYGRIIKADSETHHITGIVYAPMAEDAHGNFMTAEEIQKAANWFMKNSGKIDLQHSFEQAEGVSVVESYIAPCDMEIGGEAITKGTWLMTVEVENADVWEAVQKEEITGFSMGGIGKYAETDIPMDDIEKADSAEKKGLFKRLASLLGLDVIEKGVVRELYENRMQNSGFWEAWSVLHDILQQYNNLTGKWELETNEAAVREALADFSAIITGLLTGGEQSIVKALAADAAAHKKENEKEEVNMTKQELETTIDERLEKALAPIKKALEDAAELPSDAAEPPKPNDGGITATGDADLSEEVVSAVVEKCVAKALEPMEALLKSRGVSSNLNNEQPVQKAETHYLAGIL